MLSNAYRSGAGPISVRVDHRVVHNTAVASSSERDAVVVIGDDDVVLDDPVHEHPVEASDALKRTAVGLPGVFEVDDRITPQDHPDDFPASDSLRSSRPALEPVVMVGADVVAVLHHVVLEDTVVTEAAEAVSGEVLDRIVLYQRMRRTRRDAEVDVLESIVTDCHSRAVRFDAAR